MRLLGPFLAQLRPSDLLIITGRSWGGPLIP